MDETTTLKLLSHVARQLADHFNEGERVDAQALADRLAEVTWETLLFMMRQSFANEEEITLSDVGHFEKAEGQWVFQPAASLAEAESINMPSTEGYRYLARQALFYLDEAAKLIESIPNDIEIGIAHYAPQEGSLSARVAVSSKRLARASNRLQEGSHRSDQEIPSNIKHGSAVKFLGDTGAEPVLSDDELSTETGEAIQDAISTMYGQAVARPAEDYDFRGGEGTAAAEVVEGFEWPRPTSEQTKKSKESKKEPRPSRA